MFVIINAILLKKNSYFFNTFSIL